MISNNGSKTEIEKEKKMWLIIKPNLLVLGGVLLLSTLMTSCVTKKRYNEVLDQVAALSVQSEMDDYDKVDTLYERSDVIYRLKQSLLAQREKADSLQSAIEDMQDRPTLASEILAELESGDWKVKSQNGQLSVDIENDILFDTGEASLSDGGKKKIEKLAKSVKGQEQGVHIWVIGHTDEKPYVGSSMDNWSLSSRRALAVTRLLIDAGLNATDIVAAARGQFDPEATNNGQVGRLLNRRTEILIIPKSEWSEVVAQFVSTF